MFGASIHFGMFCRDRSRDLKDMIFYTYGCTYTSVSKLVHVGFFSLRVLIACHGFLVFAMVRSAVGASSQSAGPVSAFGQTLDSERRPGGAGTLGSKIVYMDSE